jgi:16S rRNA (uracil1498-N3)-methyltransferase
MADRFFTPDQLTPGEYTLTGAEAHHLSAVRRFGQGDCVTLFNGDGNDYPAEVVATGKKTVTLNVLRVELADRELPHHLVVAAALPKGDRADFLIEKLTELGVSRFVPLSTSRAIVQPRASIVDKFSRAVIEASKQCGRNRLMHIDPPRSLSALLALTDLPPTRLLLHTEASSLLPTSNAGGVVVAVGPEGGFSPEEVAAATQVGWLLVSLGKRVLRVETAAIAAAALLGSR